MYSWRLLILPQIGQSRLYAAYDLTEPWDGLKNKKLSATHLKLYACPCDLNACASDAARTSYVGSGHTAVRLNRLPTNRLCSRSSRRIIEAIKADSTLRALVRAASGRLPLTMRCGDGGCGLLVEQTSNPLLEIKLK